MGDVDDRNPELLRMLAEADPWADTRKLVDMAARRAMAHPEDGWAADFAEQVAALLAANRELTRKLTTVGMLVRHETSSGARPPTPAELEMASLLGMIRDVVDGPA